MQTLISVRRRGWCGQIASLPLSFFFLFLVSLPRPQVALCVPSGPMRVQKRVVPLKGVLLGGLNNVPLNFGGKIPQKLKFWGRE